VDNRVWLKRSECAAVLGISARHFDEKIRPNLLAEATRGTGKDLRFDAAFVVGTWVNHRLANYKPPAPDPADADFLMNGPVTPGLEKLRNIRCGQEQIKLDLMTRRVIEVDQLKSGLAMLAGNFRRAGEAIQYRFGDEAAAILRDAIDRFEEECEKTFAADAGGDGATGAIGAGAVTDAPDPAAA
jgi:hypothetical protein